MNNVPSSLTLIHNRNIEWDESKVTRDASGQFARSAVGQRIIDRKIDRAGNKAFTKDLKRQTDNRKKDRHAKVDLTRSHNVGQMARAVEEARLQQRVKNIHDRRDSRTDKKVERAGKKAANREIKRQIKSQRGTNRVNVDTDRVKRIQNASEAVKRQQIQARRQKLNSVSTRVLNIGKGASDRSLKRNNPQIKSVSTISSTTTSNTTITTTTRR